MEKTKTIKRDSNIELYRIIVMAMIVAGHYVVNSDLYSLIQKQPLTTNSVFYYLFGGWGKTGINCFVLITGYFMCKSSITIKKYLKLLFEVIFYNVVLYFSFVLTGYNSFSVTNCVLSFIPIKSIIPNDFTSCFLSFFLFIPFLNILVNNMNQKQHLYLIIISLLVFTGVAFIPSFEVTMNYIAWFSVLYFISSYIQLYDFPHKNDKRFWLMLSILSVFVSFASIMICLLIQKYIGISVDSYYFLVDSNAVMAVMTSVSLFNLFRNIKIPYNKYINAIAFSMFGVLLIHANSDTMRQWLWNDFFANAAHYASSYYALRYFGIVILVMIVCVTIDQIRIHTIEKFTFKYIDKFLAKRNLK